MRKQAVCLFVTYDETTQEPPAQWDWATLIDAPDASHVQLIYIGDVIGEPAPTTTTIVVPEDARIASEAIDAMSGVTP